MIELESSEVPADFDRHAFRWHLYLWSPWFFVWGTLLGPAARRLGATGPAPRPGGPHPRSDLQ
ncbi:hypothetical protein ABGB12_33120 [Actinocorallia sp. B10E7]|uniref:hypothetical protein n=1 Tax=Actinocorallia sp. B10E7 TaxID=3153558 RepID=UPI00325EF5FC